MSLRYVIFLQNARALKIRLIGLSDYQVKNATGLVHLCLFTSINELHVIIQCNAKRITWGHPPDWSAQCNKGYRFHR